MVVAPASIASAGQSWAMDGVVMDVVCGWGGSDGML